MFSKNVSNAFALFCLVGTVWASIATSSSDGSLYGSFHVKSDCVNPRYDGSIYVSNSSISTPSITFMNLGFPTATLTIGTDSTGVYNGANRVCSKTLDNSVIGRGKEMYLYTCADDGQFVCNVYLQADI